MFKVEMLMGFASFGEKSREENFYRDLQVHFTRAKVLPGMLDHRYGEKNINWWRTW